MSWPTQDGRCPDCGTTGTDHPSYCRFQDDHQDDDYEQDDHDDHQDDDDDE